MIPRCFWRLGCALWLLASNSMYAQAQPHAMQARASTLSMLRAQLESAKTPDASLFRQYFDTFPEHFSDLQDWFGSQKYRDVLDFTPQLRDGDADYGYVYSYQLWMCRTYEHVGHLVYLRKVLRIGIEANNWGGPRKDEYRWHIPGEMYRFLAFGGSDDVNDPLCGSRTGPEAFKNRIAEVYGLIAEYSDDEVEALYNSLAWDGMKRFGMEWFLKGVCDRYPSRCELTERLEDKYVKPLYRETGT